MNLFAIKKKEIKGKKRKEKETFSSMFTGSSRISVCPSTKRKIEKDGDRNNKICSSEADNNNKSDLVFRSTKNFLLVRAPSIFEANH